MKSVFLSSCAVVVICALPVSADGTEGPLMSVSVVPAETSGYLEIYGGWASAKKRANGSACIPVINDCFFFRSLDDGFKGAFMGGAARGNHWLTPSYSLQLDLQAEDSSNLLRGTSANDRSSALDYLTGMHANWRDSNFGLIGAFAGIGDVNTVRHAVFGAEGQAYWKQFTGYLQAGYDTTVHGSGIPLSVLSNSRNQIVDMDAWFVRGTGRYYVTPNLRLEATGLYADGIIAPSFLGCSTVCFVNASFASVLWEAKAEWKPDNSSVALFLKYRGSQTDYKLSANATGSSVFETAVGRVMDNIFLLGARISLGENSLIGSDRVGASLDVMSPLAIPSGPLYAPLGNLFLRSTGP